MSPEPSLTAALSACACAWGGTWLTAGLQREALVVLVDIDRYGRTVGKGYVSPQDVNAELVRGGPAWVYQQYMHDPALLPLEAEARGVVAAGPQSGTAVGVAAAAPELIWP